MTPTLEQVREWCPVLPELLSWYEHEGVVVLQSHADCKHITNTRIALERLCWACLCEMWDDMAGMWTRSASSDIPGLNVMIRGRILSQSSETREEAILHAYTAWRTAKGEP